MTNLTASNLRDLLRDCRLGDEAAARALYAHAAPSMRAYARAILTDAGLSDDVVQQAFLRVLREDVSRIETLREPLAWLLSLTRSEAMTMLRTRLRTERREAGAAPKTHDRPASDDLDELRTAIAALPSAHRELLVLKHVCDLTFGQIAVAMNLNRSTAASRYRVALEALRRHMAPTAAQEAGYA